MDEVCEKPAFHTHPHAHRRHHRRSHSLDVERDEDMDYYDELGDDEGYMTDEYDFSAPFNG